MKEKYISIMVLAVLLVLIFANMYSKKIINQEETLTSTETSKYTLPISQRSFYLGLTPTPKHWPNSSFSDIVAAYEETGKIAEVAMVWVEKQGIGEFEILKKNRIIEGIRVYGLKPVITLNFAKIEIDASSISYVIDAPEGIVADLSDQEFRKRWIEEAKDIAQEFKPEYFSLGNEINDYFYIHPEELNPYLSLFDEAKKEIKTVSPKTKVFVVFSYNNLIENEQWHLIQEFDSRVDVIGLTSYPWKQYEVPEDISADYYSKIKQYTTKPIVFTEIGWISSPPATEKQQSEFLLKFLERTRDLKVEIVSWLFLHEIEITGFIGKISSPEVGTIALKKSDGTDKEIYSLWLNLKKLPKIT